MREEQHQVGTLVAERAPLSTAHNVAELGCVELTLGQQTVPQGDDAAVLDVRGHGVGQYHGQVGSLVSPPGVPALLHGRGSGGDH